MKTILSLIALLTLIGLLPFAVAESKSAAKAAKASAVSSTPAKEGKVIPAPAESTASTTAMIPASPKPAASAGSKATSVKTSAKGKPEASKPSSTSTSTSVKASTGSASSRTTGKPVAKADSIAALTATQEDKLLVLLNEGTVEDLSAIPGIASTRAASIVKARPFASVHEIVLVEGVGNATFERILAHGKSLTQRTASKPEASRKS